MTTKMTEAEIAEKKAQVSQLKRDRIELKKSIREHQHNEWMKYLEQFESVYVFRVPNNFSLTDSILTCGLDPEDFTVRPVTVVGVVKKEDDGSYTLQIGWSQCSANDTYDRKVGNLIAIQRAANPETPFQTTHGLMTMPMVLKGFNSKFVKSNFISIATLIIDEYEDAVNIYTGEPLERTTGMVFTYKQGIDADEPIDLVEGVDYEDVTDKDND